MHPPTPCFTLECGVRSSDHTHTHFCASCDVILDSEKHLDSVRCGELDRMLDLVFQVNVLCLHTAMGDCVCGGADPQLDVSGRTLSYIQACGVLADEAVLQSHTQTTPVSILCIHMVHSRSLLDH